MPTVAELFDQLIDQLADDVAEKVMPKVDARIAEAIAKPTPEPAPEPEPEQPEQEELPIAATAQISNSTGGEWQNGVSVQTSRFMIRETTQARLAFVKGATVKFSDGQSRKIKKVDIAHGNIYPEVEGAKLPASVGYPNTVSAVKGDEDEAEPEGELPATKPDHVPAPKPVPDKRKGVMGTAIGMGMGKPEVVPGVIDRDWFAPTEDDIVRAKSYGLVLLRLGSLRERIIRPGGKHELYLGEKDALPQLIKACRWAKKHGCLVMPDFFHNYGGFSEGNNAAKNGNPQHKKIGTNGGPSYDTFAYDSKAIIQYLQTDPDCWDAIYGIDNMNEWVGLPGDNVFYAHQRFLDVCAPIMGNKMAILEGNAYSNTPNFWDHNPKFPLLKDPRGKGFIEFSGHLYADQDYSGTYETGDTVRKGEDFDTFYINRLKPFLDGCEKHGAKASIGEWVVPGDHPKLLEGARKGIEYGLGRGCNFIAFGMGRGYSSKASNHWNLEIARNKPTLDMIKRITGVAA